MNENNNKIQANINRLEKFSKVLDTKIGVPGTKFDFGLDAVIGLIPGFGDIITGATSSYFIYLAIIMGARKRTLSLMLFNTLIDTIVGLVPVAGDIFDFFWKSNSKNYNLLNADYEAGYLKEPDHKRIGIFLIVIMITLILIVFSVAFLVLKASLAFWSLI